MFCPCAIINSFLNCPCNKTTKTLKYKIMCLVYDLLLIKSFKKSIIK